MLLLLAACALPVDGEVSLPTDAGAWEDPSAAPLPTDFFLVPKTQEALDAYVAQIHPGSQARLTIMESALNTRPDAVDLEDALAGVDAYLEATRRNLPLLAGHQTLLFPIAKMPHWLSSSDDLSLHSEWDTWTVANTRPPADMDTWALLVERSVRALKAEYPDTQLAFEVWNEPDIYWTGSQAELLELYTVTSAAILRGDETALVGGFGTNQPDGGVGEGPLVPALLDHVQAHDLPLDFVSVHYFGDHPASVRRFAQQVDAWKADAGRPELPVWITEWNDTSTFRGSDSQPASFAAIQAEMRRQGWQQRYMAAWEDFSEHRDNAGYGLLQYGGQPKPVTHVHAAMRALQDGEIQPLSSEQEEVEGVAGRKAGCTAVLLWRHSPDPIVAASEVLLDHTTTAALEAAYGDETDALLADMEAGDSRDDSLDPAFAAAAEAWAQAAHDLEVSVVAQLDLAGAPVATRLDGEEVETVDLDRSGPTPSLLLDPNAVVWVESCEATGAWLTF